MLALAWRYRAQCISVVVQQLLLVAMGLAGLGLAGLGIDVIRHAADPQAAAAPLALGERDAGRLAAAGAWWSGIAVAIVLLALVQSTLRYHTTLVVARLSQRDRRASCAPTCTTSCSGSAFASSTPTPAGSIINRVAGDVQAMRMFVDGVIIEVLTVRAVAGRLSGLHASASTSG